MLLTLLTGTHWCMGTVCWKSNVCKRLYLPCISLYVLVGNATQMVVKVSHINSYALNSPSDLCTTLYIYILWFVLDSSKAILNVKYDQIFDILSSFKF